MVKTVEELRSDLDRVALTESWIQKLEDGETPARRLVAALVLANLYESGRSRGEAVMMGGHGMRPRVDTRGMKPELRTRMMAALEDCDDLVALARDLAPLPSLNGRTPEDVLLGLREPADER